VVLAGLGVRRWRAWSTSVVVIGFIATKTTTAGAATVSAGWSLTGIPTHIVADPSDLLALPAVLAVAVLWRRAEAEDGRSRAAAVLGVALLPFGVLATAATGACDVDDGITTVDAVTGRLSGGDGGRERLLVMADHHDLRAIDTAGAVISLARLDRERLGDVAWSEGGACLADGETCWRVGVENDVVETSSDGGRSWRTELSFPAEDQARALEGVAESCGEQPQAWLGDLALMETAEGPLVVVTAFHAGAWVRHPVDGWRLVDRAALAARPAPEEVTPAPGMLRSIPPVVPPFAPPGEPTPAPASPAPLTCPPRERETTTPRPANGEPFEVCPG
jgi:hypothetical protein